MNHHRNILSILSFFASSPLYRPQFLWIHPRLSSSVSAAMIRLLLAVRFFNSQTSPFRSISLSALSLCLFSASVSSSHSLLPVALPPAAPPISQSNNHYLVLQQAWTRAGGSWRRRGRFTECPQPPELRWYSAASLAATHFSVIKLAAQKTPD